MKKKEEERGLILGSASSSQQVQVRRSIAGRE